MNEFTDKLPSEYAKFVDDLNDILYHADFEVSGILSGTEFTLDTYYTGADDVPHPSLYLEFINDDGIWWASPTLSFPDLTFKYGDYADSMHYCLSTWESIGRVMTELNKYDFDSEEYLADLANGEFD